jgi:hypothetical protein
VGVSYRTLDVPPFGAGAFMPSPARNPVASSYGLVQVEGAPGTDVVPSPRPAALPALTRRAGVDSAQGSAVAPDVILPAIYVAFADNMGPECDTGIGMARRRLNELPVRAIDPGRLPVPVWQQYPAGARPLPWPRAFIRWPSRTPHPGQP